MQELYNQIIDYLKGIWIRRRFIILTSWLLCPIGWGLVANLDNIYQSEARVYVDTQTILRPLLEGLTVEKDTDIQIKLMIRTLLKRSNLERIARMTDLDIQATTPEEYEELVESLERDIKIVKARAKENIFSISYEHNNPQVARNVVQSALDVFIENTLGENRSDSDEAQRFLNEQIKDYENRLSESESRLTAFKQQYSNVLPNQYGGYYNKLNIAKEQLKAIELNLSEIESQLENAKVRLKRSPQQLNNTSNKIKNANTIVTTYDERISELETQLDSLELKYTDKHPDVLEVKRRLTHLNTLRGEEIDTYLGSQTDESAPEVHLSQNPVIQDLQIQINQLEGVVASTKVRRDNYKSQVADLESKIHTLPEIEAKLAGLNRGYDITKTKYEEFLSRKETFNIADKAEQSTSKIKFKVLEPPRVPTKPSGPKHILLILMVTFVGFGAGIGLSFLFSQINPIVTSSNQLAAVTGIPIFGVVSASENLGLKAWHKKKTIIFIISNSLLLLILASFITYFLFPTLIAGQLKGAFNL